MNRTQFFTDSIAATLRPVLAEAGIKLPVHGQVTTAAPDGPRLEVRCTEAEDLIPGNYTMRFDCQLAMCGLDAAEDESKTEKVLYQVADACWPVLAAREQWRRKPLQHPEPGSDPEYEAEPFIVLDLIAAPEVIEVAQANYEGVLGFRAFVQC